MVCCGFFFFFQAEDGIRDLTVTGVQTCALPISGGLGSGMGAVAHQGEAGKRAGEGLRGHLDRKSTRLNSSHSQISYAVFCLKIKSSAVCAYIARIAITQWHAYQTRRLTFDQVLR